MLCLHHYHSSIQICYHIPCQLIFSSVQHHSSVMLSFNYECIKHNQASKKFESLISPTLAGVFSFLDQCPFVFVANPQPTPHGGFWFEGSSRVSTPGNGWNKHHTLFNLECHHHKRRMLAFWKLELWLVTSLWFPTTVKPYLSSSNLSLYLCE